MNLRRSFPYSTIVVIAFVSAFAFPARPQAQVGASVGGVVSDDTGALLPGVTVTITNRANGTMQTVITGPEGSYRAVALPPAPYEIKIELTGFTVQTRVVTLTVGADARVDVKLTLASVQENVTVSGAAPLVETARSEPTSVVLADQIETLAGPRP